MLVFNLTAQELNYKGRKIPPNGGSLNYPELDKGFIPDRDRALEKKKVLAFGSLPYWWKLSQKVKSETLTRIQVNARDEERLKRIKEATPETLPDVVVEAMSEKIKDEMKVESWARTVLPIKPVESQEQEQKDRNYGGKRRK